MDLHRCRFVPYPPSAINAIAVSHPNATNLGSRSAARVAIGRANGDIEIWHPFKNVWLQETVLNAGKDRSIDGLVWVTEPNRDFGAGAVMQGRMRLFSIGYTSTVTEWDIAAGRPRAHASGQHGNIWCLAGQPAPPGRPSDSSKTSSGAGSGSSSGAGSGSSSGAGSGSKLVAGTIDGELAVYSIEDGALRFERLAARSSARKTQMVSIAFQSYNVVVVGCSDSSIRAYDIRRGALLRSMALGTDLAGGSKNIIVWSVKALPGGVDFVSADSTGHVCIWDGKTYTQVQKIQCHGQDALSLAVSADGNSIVSGGMDRRSVLIKRSPGRGSGHHHRWGKVLGRRYHHHDVKAMASFETGQTSVVISGGPDASPVITPLKNMGKENHRTLAALPQCLPVMSAPKARFLISWWDREVHIWRLRPEFNSLFDSSETAETAEALESNRTLLKTIVLKGESSITAAAINEAGTLLVVSTCSAVKAFSLEHEPNTEAPSPIRVSRVTVPPRISQSGATKIQLSPGGTALAVVQNNVRLLVCGITTNLGGAGPDSETEFAFSATQRLNRLSRNIPKHIRLGGLAEYNRAITQLAFSHDGRVLAAADLSGYIDTWVMRDRHHGMQNGTGPASEEDHDQSSSSSDSEDDPVQEKNRERWTRSPTANLFPRLRTSPVILSFSPRLLPQAPPRAQAPDRVEAAGSGQGADEDYTLLAVTACWDVLVFDALRGSLSKWSRRNRQLLPDKITNTLDTVKGALWQGPRVWLYGASFLCMLDLSQELPRKPGKRQREIETGAEPAADRTAKRKRGAHENSGAGGQMQIGSLVPREIRKREHGRMRNKDIKGAKSGAKEGAAEEGDGEGGGGEEEEEDEEEEDEAHFSDADEFDHDHDHDNAAELARQPRREGTAEGMGKGARDASGGGPGGKKRSWWITYKYRPILGIVPMDNRPDGSPDMQNLEAALIERPFWDIDMPERLFGPDEWER